jgi:Uma2 family endonuclease
MELNRQGQIIMSPTRYKHGYFQTEIAWLLKNRMPQGYVTTECGIETSDGTKVADATWSSAERFQVNRDMFSCSIAPEICVEVSSPANAWDEMMRKRDLYFQQGALEYWLCDELGNVRFFDHTGEIDCSRLCPAFPNRIGE